MSVELNPSGVACNIGCVYCYENPLRDAKNVNVPWDWEKVRAALDKEGEFSRTEVNPSSRLSSVSSRHSNTASSVMERPAHRVTVYSSRRNTLLYLSDTIHTSVSLATVRKDAQMRARQALRRKLAHQPREQRILSNVYITRESESQSSQRSGRATVMKRPFGCFVIGFFDSIRLG